MLSRSYKNNVMQIIETIRYVVVQVHTMYSCIKERKVMFERHTDVCTFWEKLTIKQKIDGRRALSWLNIFKNFGWKPIIFYIYLL